MTALPDHRAGGIRGLAARLGGIAPAAGASIVRSRLFIKYVALFVAVVSLALVANGVFDVYFTYQEQKASLVRIQREQAEAAAGKIGQFIGEIESQVGWTTQLPWSAGTLEQRRFDALRLLRQVPAITELAEIDSSGHEQLKVSRLAMEVVGSGTDVSKEPSFAEAVPHKVYYGPVYFRRESEPYMTLSLAGTRRDTGVSIAQVNLKLIWDVLSKIKFSGHGRAYVIDAAGRLIAHPDISLVLRNTDMSQLAQVRSARAKVAGKDGEEVEEADDIAGHKVLIASAPVAPLGWLVFVETPVQEAYAPLYASLQRTGLILLGALALAFAAGMFLARRMVVPIHALRAGAARLGGGDLGQRIAIKTGDEVEALANQFNDMAGRLQESYADLERKVEERTQELHQRTDELGRSVGELRALGEVSQAVNSTLDLETVLSTIVAKAVPLSGTDAGAIYVYDAAQREFHLRATYGMDQELIHILNNQHIGHNEPNVAAVLSRQDRCTDMPEPLLDHVIGECEQCGWHFDAERHRRLQVDNELKLGRLHDRQVGRLGALEDTAGINADLTKRVCEAGSVAHQPASFHVLTLRISRGNLVARRQGGKLHALGVEECVARDEEGIGALARKGGKGRIYLPARAGINDLDLQPVDAGSFLHAPQCDLGARSIGGIEQHGNTNGLGHELI